MLRPYHIAGFGILFWLMIVLALTMLPGRGGMMYLIASFFSRSELHGAMGHMGLMASLVLVLYVGLSQKIPAKYALLLTVIVVFAVGTCTELYQAGVAGRASTLTDLLANWVGTFAAAYGISLINGLFQCRESR